MIDDVRSTVQKIMINMKINDRGLMELEGSSEKRVAYTRMCDEAFGMSNHDWCFQGS